MMATPNRRTRKRGRRACPLPSAVLALVGALVNHSLLAKDDESPNPGPARFTMLDTIRAFAHERLTASGEAEDAAARHAAWFLALAERAEPELQGPAQRAWLDRLDAEIDNLRAALAWMFARGDALAALPLTGATGMFWLKQGRYAEGRTWVARALAADDHTGRDAANRQTAVHAKALPTAGSLAFVQGDFAAAMASHEAAPRTASPVWSSRSRPPPARRPARSAAPPLQGICPGFGTGCRCCPKSGADIGCSFRNKPQQCSPNGFYCLLNNNDPGDEDCECGGELICGGGPGKEYCFAPGVIRADGITDDWCCSGHRGCTSPSGFSCACRNLGCQAPGGSCTRTLQCCDGIRESGKCCQPRGRGCTSTGQCCTGLFRDAGFCDTP